MRKLKVIEDVWSVDREPLLFMRGDAHAKSNRSREERRSVGPCFLCVVMHVLKVIEPESYIDR
jgi:hypothetical protein